jgi:hypothetical protein
VHQLCTNPTFSFHSGYFWAKSRFPDLLETLAVKSDGWSRWSQVRCAQGRRAENGSSTAETACRRIQLVLSNRAKTEVCAVQRLHHSIAKVVTKAPSASETPLPPLRPPGREAAVEPRFQSRRGSQSTNAVKREEPYSVNHEFPNGLRGTASPVVVQKNPAKKHDGSAKRGVKKSTRRLVSVVGIIGRAISGRPLSCDLPAPGGQLEGSGAVGIAPPQRHESSSARGHGADPPGHEAPPGRRI